jgi:hypothetical protein
MGDTGKNRCLIMLDGTDFPIMEPKLFSPAWYTHKMNGPGLRYEIGICIQTGWVVWANGPFPCGAWPDLHIARAELLKRLARNEMYIGDGGYNDGRELASTPTGRNTPMDKMESLVRVRHETING